MTGSRFGAARFARPRHSLAVSLSYGVGMGTTGAFCQMDRTETSAVAAGRDGTGRSAWFPLLTAFGWFKTYG